MDIKSLRCFVEVAERLNFSRAAEALFLSQPTLSIRISELEQELGTALFIRDHQKVFLTAAGSGLLPMVRDILAGIDALPAAAKAASVRAELPSSLVIGVDPTETRCDIRPIRNIMDNFRKLYPETEVSIVPVRFDSYVQALLDGDVDICLVVTQDSETCHPDLLTIPLLRDATVLASAHAEGMDLEELLTSRDLVLLRDELHTRWSDTYARYAKGLVPGARILLVDDEAALCMHLLYRKVAAFLPESYAAALESADISTMPTGLEDTVLTLVWDRHDMNPALQLYVNEARSEIARMKARLRSGRQG